MKKNWIQKAIKNKGGLHKALGVPIDMSISAGKMKMALKSRNEHIKKMAQLAKTLKKIRK